MTMNAMIEPVLEHERTRHSGAGAERHTDAQATSADFGASLPRVDNAGFDSGRAFATSWFDFSGRGIQPSPLHDV
jgi:hypothetical protein